MLSRKVTNGNFKFDSGDVFLICVKWEIKVSRPRRRTPSRNLSNVAVNVSKMWIMFLNEKFNNIFRTVKRRGWFRLKLNPAIASNQTNKWF